MAKVDFLVVGGGIVGLNVALELRKRYPGHKVALLEKEATCHEHASGRNSGVLHAGFYYAADSLKARFTRDGNNLMTYYCQEKKLPINRCGKLVVAKDETELPMLDELLRRGERNRVTLRSLTAREAREIEPRAKTFERAIFSPDTSSVDPEKVVDRMMQDAIDKGIQVSLGTRYLSRPEPGRIETSQGSWECGYLVNTAGLYADQVARDHGFSKDYRILPFKGLYLKSSLPPGSLRTHVYPVPDLKYPFLGVHFTVQVDGHVKIGPSALPALWREQYAGMERFEPAEFAEILWRNLELFALSSFDYRRLAVTELRKVFRRVMVGLGGELLEGVREEDFPKWGRPGIRAQLVNTATRKLEMDFVIEGDNRSLHVLNAVSPAFTCSIPFSKHVVDQIENRI